MGKPKQEKTKEERLQEGISLLKQLKETGMKDHTMTYLQIKQRVTNWIQTGGALEESLPAPEYNRTVELSFPRYNNRAADIRLKVNHT